MPGFLLLLCREDEERYQSSRTGEDMCGVPQNFIFYEIVRISDLFHHSFQLVAHLTPFCPTIPALPLFLYIPPHNYIFFSETPRLFTHFVTVYCICNFIVC
jgi:hypothetical protein